MNRKQKSGAEKRKIAAEKKAKEEATKSKIPKINTLFNPLPSTSSASEQIDELTNASDCEIASTATSDCEIDLPGTQEADEIDIDLEDGSELVSESLEFSSDAGLWEMSANEITSLQKYWIGKGESPMPFGKYYV